MWHHFHLQPVETISSVIFDYVCKSCDLIFKCLYISTSPLGKPSNRKIFFEFLDELAHSKQF